MEGGTSVRNEKINYGRSKEYQERKNELWNEERETGKEKLIIEEVKIVKKEK